MITGFADRVRGRVVLPGDAEWDADRRIWNLAYEQAPAAIVHVTDADDVTAAVRFAAERGLQVAAQRTGHTAFGAADGTLLVRTDALTGVEIDERRAVARVGAGTLWSELVERAAPFGLAALHGTTGTVGVTGYALAGGIGWYARRFGLAAGDITAVELVGADGHLRRVDGDNDPELLWALRGGGGSFGIVTALELRLHPVVDVHAGALFFDVKRAGEVLRAWWEWTLTAPDEVTSLARITRFAPSADVPERSFVGIGAVTTGDAYRSLQPLLELGPTITTFAPVSLPVVGQFHGDPPEPVPYMARHQMLRELSANAIDAFVDAVGTGETMRAQIRHLGGALAHADPDGGALAHVDAAYLSQAVAGVFDGDRAGAEAQLARVDDALSPWDTRRRWPNFTTAPIDVSCFYLPATHRRLRAVKAAVDPSNVIKADHPIASAQPQER